RRKPEMARRARRSPGTSLPFGVRGTSPPRHKTCDLFPVRGVKYCLYWTSTVIPTWKSDRRSGASLCRDEKTFSDSGTADAEKPTRCIAWAWFMEMAAMPQIFHRSFNAISRVTIFGAVFILAGLGAILAIWVRSSYVTSVGIARVQPVPFSHEHHVNGL